LRGTIFLYQGDELGLPHADVPFERLRDPEAIAFWPSGIGRDGARTPMPWREDAPMADFTSASDAWLPLDPRHRALAVEAQANDPASVLSFTRTLVGLRKAHKAQRDGAISGVSEAGTALSFVREADGERLLCLFNLGEAPVSAALPIIKRTLLQVGEVSVSERAAQLGGYSALIVAT
jgi:alpha-glucosidase